MKTTRCCPFAPPPLQKLLHYYEQLRPSAWHRYSVPCGFGHLGVSLSIHATGSRSSIEEPSTDSRHLYAGHHLHSIRNSLADLSDYAAPGFDVGRVSHDGSTVVRVYSSLCTTHARSSLTFPHRSRPPLLMAAGLKPASDSGLRRAYHHLFHSFHVLQDFVL